MVNGPEQITPAAVFAALDETTPCQKKTRTIVSAPNKGISDKAPRPSLTITGKGLEAVGFRITKKVTVRMYENMIVVTVDNPGPDPAVDDYYERIEKNRTQMSDIYDTMLYGRPLREIEMYARMMEKEEQERLAQVAEPNQADRGLPDT